MKEQRVNLTQIETVAINFMSKLQPGDVVYMQGDLGAGKTTFVRAAIQSILGSDEPVPSPTFTLVQTYDTLNGPIYHYDLYRLVDPEEVLELGMNEAFHKGITFIEWPQRMGNLHDPNHYIVSLEAAKNSGERLLKIICP
ncbi:MAG: tRNA (adenosine(37)-N6)-threonylcarbamoyltransferase complex ATPase subunit type 1 TsaE [Candidatus Paracaedibacteraceae bacterium]|nr:tRNA (adenosine(37)-N6)-threonylcarbamoyltransferase complex ATPase subunit type 1 TsaE [Candidatus Paracaedibacteraceae bacterium]